MKIRLPRSLHPTVRVGTRSKIANNVLLSTNVIVSKNVKIGKGTKVASNSFIGRNVTIGENCIIGSNVVLSNCQVGNSVVFKAGCKIGQDGFGFNPATTTSTTTTQNVTKKPQSLSVIICDHVEIGANTTIDRGSWRNTVIGEYTKLDNLIQIGHNVQIGKNCLICAQVGIAGSVTIGDRVLIGGQAGISQHLNIGNDCQIAAKSGVISSLPSFSKVGGYPAVSITQFHRTTIKNKNDK